MIPKGFVDPAIKDLNSRAAGIEQGLLGRLGNVMRKGHGKTGRRGPVLALRLLLLVEALLPPQPQSCWFGLGYFFNVEENPEPNY